MTGELARLFMALELPAEVRSALDVWSRELVGATGRVGRVRRVEPDSLHVTLCFLGARPLAEIDAIAEACGAVAGLAPAALTLDGARWLPPRRPRVLTVTLADAQDRLAAVHSALAGALADGGFYAPETRPFLAHVTVARVQRAGRPRRGELPPPEALQFIGDTVTLYRSRLGGGPARYEVLTRVTLAG